MGFGIAALFPLLMVLIYALPDGRERFELAQFFGRFHPLAVHLPVALLLLVPLLELAALVHRQTHLRFSAGFVPGLATISAIASAPTRCTDETLAQFPPVANLIVDAELARTKVTDKGMRALAGFSNLKSLDLSSTAVTSAGMKDLVKLKKLESLNLTGTNVTHDAVDELQTKPGLKHLYLFETR